MDIHILARNACLSVGQVRELESGKSGNYFYSETIKRQAYKRVLIQLGEKPPETNSTKPLTEPPEDLDARLAPLDSIVAMSHRPAMASSIVTRLQPALNKLKQHKSTIGLFAFLILAFAVMSQYINQRTPSATQTTISAVTTQEATPLANAPTTPPALAPIAVAADPFKTASTPTSTLSEFKCAPHQEPVPQWSPTQARKEGRYVYLVSGSTTEVCVVDAQKRMTHLHMKAGESQSVYGSAPWQISGTHLQKIKIYFQGSLVSLPEDAKQAVSLVEAPVSP
jgi:hypothetical protein